MKLDIDYLYFMEKQDFRMLVAVENGMKNHQWVPQQLAQKIARIHNADSYKVLQSLLKNKLLSHINKKCKILQLDHGYKLTSLGYDYLAIKALMNKGLIERVQSKIGIGKQSDIYLCINSEGVRMALKLTRLGRTSFKTVKNNRDYIKHRTQYNWLYLSRLSAIKQFAFMQLLYKNGFPTPVPIEWNRHAILMSLIQGVNLYHVKQLNNPERVFKECLQLCVKFAQYGLIHGDLNEFNLMIEQGQKIRVIDFPQCISRNHVNGEFYFNRDVECLFKFFQKISLKMRDQKYFFDVSDVQMPVLQMINCDHNLDKQVKASGYLSTQKYNEEDFDFITQLLHQENAQEIENVSENSKQQQSQQQQQQKQHSEKGQSIKSEQQLNKKKSIKISRKQKLGQQQYIKKAKGRNYKRRRNFQGGNKNKGKIKIQAQELVD